MFPEPLHQFFDVTSGFADTVTRSGGATFPAIFDAAYVDALEVASVGPAITAQASVALVRGEALTIRGLGYQVRTIEPDGTGVVVARLSRS